MTALLLFLIFNFQMGESSVKATSDQLQKNFKYTKDQPFLLVNIRKQEMYLVRNETIEKTYQISSAKAGVGSKAGSGQTPLGVHRISEKFGEGSKPNTIFLGRKDSGKTATIYKDRTDTEDDYVT